jgi:hypothetical protein
MLQEEFEGHLNRVLTLLTPLGKFQLSPSQWRAVILPHQWKEATPEEDRLVFRPVAQRIRENAANVMDFVKSLNWSELQLQAQFCYPRTSGANIENADASESEELLEVELPETPTAEFLAAMSATWAEAWV